MLFLRVFVGAALFVPGFVGSLSGQFLGIRGAKNNRAGNASKTNGRASSQVIGVRLFWLGHSIAFSQRNTGLF